MLGVPIWKSGLLDFSSISGIILCILLEMTVEQFVRKAVVILGDSNEVAKVMNPKL